MNLHEQIAHTLQQNLANAGGDVRIDTLDNALRLLSKWRCVLIQNTILKHQGVVVGEGIFRGLEFIENSAEGCHTPKLLGCYEQPLQPYVEELLAGRSYEVVVNVGCAEGYYAVGLALKQPQTRIHAYDIDANARATCEALAVKNGVRDRLTIGEYFSVQDFDRYRDRKALVVCDIEGAEDELLRPDESTALVAMDLIVEAHECIKPGIERLLIERFSKTHDITVVRDNGQRELSQAPDWFYNLAHLDQLLATWEWRSGPTPWLVMKARHGMAL